MTMEMLLKIGDIEVYDRSLALVVLGKNAPGEPMKKRHQVDSSECVPPTKAVVRKRRPHTAAHWTAAEDKALKALIHSCPKGVPKSRLQAFARKHRRTNSSVYHRIKHIKRKV